MGPSIQAAGEWLTKSNFLPGSLLRGSTYFLFG